jgi:hypothetical protein
MLVGFGPVSDRDEPEWPLWRAFSVAVLVLGPILAAVQGYVLVWICACLHNRLARAWGGIELGIGAEGVAPDAGEPRLQIRCVDPLHLGAVGACVAPIASLAVAAIMGGAAGVLALLPLPAAIPGTIWDSAKSALVMAPGLFLAGFVGAALAAVAYRLAARVVGGLAVEIR